MYVSYNIDGVLFFRSPVNGVVPKATAVVFCVGVDRKYLSVDLFTEVSTPSALVLLLAETDKERNSTTRTHWLA